MKISGSVTIGDTTSGDTVNSVIAALKTSDISIGGGKSYFGKDGSGWLADNSISWDSGGTMSIGKFKIGNEGIYYGDINEWANPNVMQDMAYLTPSILRLQLQKKIAGKFSKLKVGFGKYADPTHTNGGQYDSVAYFYRQMLAGTKYYPAVKIISDNALGDNMDSGFEVGNIALYVKGGVINRNGSLNNGYFMNAEKVNIIHFDRSDTQIVTNNTLNRIVHLPTRSEMKEIMGGVDNFAVTLTVIAHKDAKTFILAFQLNDTDTGWIDNKGNRLNQTFKDINESNILVDNNYCLKMDSGNAVHFVLISYGGIFWAQVL